MAWRAAEPILAALLFLLVYVVATALSLPGAALLTLVAGAVFGLLWGTVLVSIASTIGATLAFLMARFLMRDWVQGRFGEKIRTMNQRIEKDGAFYLFTLRLVPVFPFFVINLAMGLTPIRTWTFFWVSQVGMLAGTLVYVNAGTQLAQIDSLQGILSPALLASFAEMALGCGVLPPSVEGMRGQLRPAVVLVAVDRQGQVVSCAASASFAHPGHPTLAGQAWWGMLATAPQRRGEKLALVLGARAMLAMAEQFGLRDFMTGVEPGNTPSEAVCSRMGMQTGNTVIVGCADPVSLKSGRMTK
jgi:uncharacterized membrane protein YdjX (TVP38/TMEM64 family)